MGRDSVACGEHLAAGEKARPPCFQLDLLFSAFTHQLAKSEWAWIAVFSTSLVPIWAPSRQTAGDWQHRMPNTQGRRRCHSKTCSLPAPEVCWLPRDSWERRGLLYELGQNLQIKGVAGYR